MSKIVYQVVKHDGGWAYRVGETYSEAFASHDLAHKAAERAAQEQVAAGETTVISYEDERGHWHHEVSRGDDRPETEVDG
jgi:hypothetical protein